MGILSSLCWIGLFVGLFCAYIAITDYYRGGETMRRARAGQAAHRKEERERKLQQWRIAAHQATLEHRRKKRVREE